MENSENVPGSSVPYRNRGATTGNRGRGGNKRNIPTRGNSNHNFNRNRDGLPGYRPRRELTKICVKRIESLLEKGAEDIILELSDSRMGFKDLLNDQKMSDDMKVLVVKLLYKLCECSFNSNVISIFQTVLNSPFHTTLIAYISTLELQDSKEKEKNRCLWDDPDSFWNNVITITRKIYDLLPEYSSTAVLKILEAAKASLPRIEETFSMHIPDSIKNDIETLCKGIKYRIQEQQKKAATVKAIDREQQPPNDYRDIDVYPSAEEVTNKSYMPFLRRNKVKGAYADVYDYLDTQFRLLREDFVKPMREGICQYMENPRARQDAVKVYQPVRFLNRENISEDNCFRILFHSRSKQKINYENSKRFIFGSLICFTADNFHTVLFAKIASRDLKDLNNGHVIVGFNEDVILPKNIYELDFTMVESTVYFEPYYQVLNVLKTMDHQHFPMERYIIEVSTAVRPPNYLMSIDPVFYDIKGDLVCPLNWNDEHFFNFNDSQNEAYKAALSRELAVIQGPPGTGKTYLGLRVARTLLKNASAWYHQSPMLVVCYTNHALDQFLEGLLPVTTNLIRVGGRSKNERLDKYNISNRRRGNLQPAALEKKHECSGILRKVDELDSILSLIDKNNTVLSFVLFRDVVPELSSSWFNRVTENDIIQWMMDDCHIDWDNGPTENEMQVTQLHGTNDSDNGMGLAIKTDEVNVNREEHNVFLDDLDIDRKASSNMSQMHWKLIAVNDIHNEIIEKQQVLIQTLDRKDLTNYEKYILQDDLEFEIMTAVHRIRYLQEKLGQRVVCQRQGLPDFVDLDHPHRMSPDDRWKLYFYWLNLYIQSLKDEKEKLCVEFRRNCRLYTEMRDIDDARLMKNAKVVGMTTSGAARLHSSLRALKSPIVIVEEAAEVPESHIVAALTTECQHLILIGDHQQLKPSTADYTMETQFALGISLFERMVINKVQCFRLNIQHRMRPEISKLICPTIYPNLQDHESTLDRPQIKGVEQCLFFIDHQVEEQLCSDMTKKNEHEAKFLIALARHLILNGHDPDQITILAAYVGQMYEMKHEKSRHACLRDVRIAVLDNYQGEESDIILLSLVRSNKEKKIGFLKIKNRVCVALSRARNGMYIMGNMSQLVESSKIWQKINETFKQQHAIGPSLTLRCAVHTFKITHVASAHNFSKVPEGGCDLPCNTLMTCGHVCQRLCHVQDRQHTATKCIAKCNKLICDDETHLCQKLCYEECGPCSYPVSRTLDCGHTVNMKCHIHVAEYKCDEIMKSVKLPCGHTADKHCYMDVKEVRCPHPCEVRVEPCGHACTLTCHVNNDPDHVKYKCRKQCEKLPAGCKLSQGENDEVVHKCPQMCYEECRQCTIIEQRERSCGHRFKIQCHFDVEEIDCVKPCRKTLPCGHECPNKCNEPCGGCKTLLEKKIPDCGHSVKLECSASAERRMCQSDCERILPCGHRCTLKCRNDCLTKCQEIVEWSNKGPCGHEIRNIPCYLMNTADQTLLYSSCGAPCVETLKCGHVCSGTCGKCHQGRAHFRCQQQCHVTLICGHPCALPCRQPCFSCERKCEYCCTHSNCSRKCGDPCKPCRKKCLRRCQHQQCNEACSAVCSVPACRQPCLKKKRCGHPCVGFCGDRCPKLCRICDKVELTEVFFGMEGEEHARFVQLNDCGHIFEANGLDQWLVTEDEEGRTQVTVKACPKCKKPIKTTLRYKDLVNQNMKDIMVIKGKYYGSKKQIQDQKDELLKLLERLYPLKVLLLPNGDSSKDLLVKLAAILRRNPRNGQGVTLKDLDAIKIKLSLLERLLPAAKLRHVDYSVTNLPLILEILQREECNITDQELEDLNLEIDRFLRFSQLLEIQNKMKGYVTSDVTKKKEEVVAALKSHSRYDEDQDHVLKEKLQELNKLAEISVILTDAEKKVIVPALGFKQGQWFKCLKGHLYCITECGDAMQVSKCPECVVVIGGTNQLLLPIQQLETDFDI